MDDLISRQAAIDEINKLEYPSSLVDVKRIIVDLPSAERKKGEWITHHEPFTWMGYMYWTCSECGFGENDNKIRSNFCPSCGADMREGKEE